MLKRIYIDNFRCLVNFEITANYMNLFLGPNGSGKSTVFAALKKVQTFVNGEGKVSTLFPISDLTRWQTSDTQTFEVEIEGNGGSYEYQLKIRHERNQRRARVWSERLWFNGKSLLEFDENGDAHLYRDVERFEGDDRKGPVYPFDWSQSALGSLPPRNDNQQLTWFKERLMRFIIVQINPMLMRGESGEEASQLDTHTENFVSWYRYISQDQGEVLQITNALKEIWPQFEHFKFTEAGEAHRVLKLSFAGEDGVSDFIEYRFDELSDGERTLVVLYALLHHAHRSDYTLCIDEPENFLALPEIQPWLTTLYDFCSADELQALLISHHPEFIDYLANSLGYWFEYHSNAPIRAKRISDDNGTGLPMSELVSRGWVRV